MKKTINYYGVMLFLLVMLLNLNSCNYTGSNSMKTTNINLKDLIDSNQSAKTCFADLLKDNAQIIPLDTTGKILIGNYANLKMYNNQLYLLQNGKIYVYNFNGQLVQAIASKEGRGPHELLSFEDFLIDPLTGNIEILSIVDNKISIYDNTGNYIKSIPTPAPSYSFIKTNNGNYVLSKGATYDGRNTVGLEQLYSIDKDGKLLSKYLKHDVIDMYGPLAESNFAGDGENIFYKNIFDENIYVITPDTAQVLYNFDFGPYKIDEKILKLDKDKILQEIGTISFININTLLVNQNYVYVYFQKEKSGIIESYHFMYEIKSGNSLIIRQDGKSAESSYIIPKLLTANNELLFLMDAEYMNEPDKQQLCSGALVPNNCKSTLCVIKISISDLFSAK